MLDADRIKQTLTDDDIISVLSELGADFVHYDDKQIIFYSICHHPNDPIEHKPKLYYYNNSKSFYCFSCGFSGDIFSLVEKVKGISFVESISFICSLCNIESNVEYSTNIDNWQADLKKFLPNYEPQEEIKIYDGNILNLFDRLYHKSWLDYGISKESMDKFQIGFYTRRNQISIPVFYNNNLIGIRIRALSDWDVQKGKYRPLIDINNNIYKFPTGSVFYGWDQNKSNIEKSGVAWICEGEKTVLKFDTWGYNNVLAVFGSNITKSHINKLLSIGVKTVVLMMDSDYHTIGDDEYNIFVAKMKKNIDKLKPYFNVEVVYNNIGNDAYKFSPTDYTISDFNKIYNKRIKV